MCKYITAVLTLIPIPIDIWYDFRNKAILKKTAKYWSEY